MPRTLRGAGKDAGNTQSTNCKTPYDLALLTHKERSGIVDDWCDRADCLVSAAVASQTNPRNIDVASWARVNRIAARSCSEPYGIAAVVFEPDTSQRKRIDISGSRGGQGPDTEFHLPTRSCYCLLSIAVHTVRICGCASK